MKNFLQLRKEKWDSYMNFNNFKWTNNDFNCFANYLLSLSKGHEKCVWEKRIVNTNYDCIAVPSAEIDKIAREISKCNYKKYLDKMLHNNLSEMLVNAKVINRIKNIDEYIYYLKNYIDLCDCWAMTDVLKFPLAKNNKELFLALSKEFIYSDKPFKIRVGLLILMKEFVNDDYIDYIFSVLNYLKDNNHYYVQMMCAWLLCECVIKVRDKSVKYIRTCNLSSFVVNKAISKCHDSFRVREKDKELLKSFRR